LDYSTGYKVEFSTGTVKDTAGNNFAGTATYNFTTKEDFSGFIEIYNQKLVQNSTTNKTYVTFDIKLDDEYYQGSKINGLLIDLKYDYAKVHSAIVTSVINIGSFQELVYSLSSPSEGSLANGKLILTNIDDNKLITDTTGKILSINFTINSLLNSFEIGFDDQGSSINTAAGTSYTPSTGIAKLATLPDTTPPTVSIFSPVDEATAVSIGNNIVATFSEDIQRGSGDIVLKTEAGTTVATYSQTSSNVTISGSTLTINPTADLNYSMGYKVEFAAGSVKDTAGNNYGGTTTYNFTTGAAPDTTPPTVSTFSPADETTSVTIGSNIVATFSEAIQRGAGDIVLKTAAGTTVATYGQTSSNVTISGNALTINPSANLNYSTGYKVEFAAGSVKDVAGNNFAGTTTYNFSTQKETASSIFSFANISRSGSVLSADLIGNWPSNIKNYSVTFSCVGVDFSKFEIQNGDLTYNWNLYNGLNTISGSTFTTPPRFITGEVVIGRVFFNSKSDDFKNISIGVSGYVTNSSDVRENFTSLPGFLSLNSPP
jgi:methionine-rich copper-binding protein CopC